jgi:hypothetical protein
MTRICFFAVYGGAFPGAANFFARGARIPEIDLAGV